MKRLPNEMISAILTFACDDAGDTIEEKFAFPSIPALISKRLRAVCMSTHGIWKHVILSGPPYTKVRAHLLRSGVLPLSVKVSGQGKDAQHQEIILPILHRIQNLSYPPTFKGTMPLLATILHCRMPLLEELDIYATTRVDGQLVPKPILFESSLFPKLRSLRCHQLIKWCDDQKKLPETLEDLYIEGAHAEEAKDPAATFCSILPPNLHSLHLGRLTLDEDFVTQPSTRATTTLPNLVRLVMEEVISEEILGLMLHVNAPNLKTAVIALDECGYFSGSVSWSWSFKALTHVQITIAEDHPEFGTILRDCSSITHISIISNKPLGYPELLIVQLEDPTLWPHLEYLQVLGQPICDLQPVVQKRPALKSLKVHVLDIGLSSDRTKEEFSELEEAVEFVKSSLNLMFSFYLGMDFHCDGKKTIRYQSWEDFQNRRFMGSPTWRKSTKINWEDD